MTVKVHVKANYGGIPVEIEADLTEIRQLDTITEAMNEVYKLAKKWETIIEKRRERVYRKMVKPLPYGSMQYAKNLFCGAPRK